MGNRKATGVQAATTVSRTLASATGRGLAGSVLSQCQESRGGAKATSLQQLGALAVTEVSVQLPATASASLGCNRDDLGQELRLAAAALWYQQGRVSQEVAAHISGLDRTDFLLALASMGIESFQVNFAELDRELAREPDA